MCEHIVMDATDADHVWRCHFCRGWFMSQDHARGWKAVPQPDPEPKVTSCPVREGRHV